MTGGGAHGNSYTRGIAGFVSGLTYDAIPVEVLARIRLLILDAIGCALYGANLEPSRILRESLCAVDSSNACAVWGTKLGLSAPHAALVNGAQVQGFELDDVHRQGVLHVGAVVLPALIAIAETRPGMSGRDFLTAAVAGYEIGPRVGICMGSEHGVQGWHTGATAGVFAAAAAAARGLGLNTDRTVHALGIGGTQACGLMAAQYGAMVKSMHAGRASQSGFYGAFLAEGGFTGILDVFESEYGGFCTTFSRSRDRFSLPELTAGLGSVWQTMGVSLKFYSCLGANHTTLDAIRGLQAESPFGADDIQKIIVHGSQSFASRADWKYSGQGVSSAQHNLSYCVATWLLDNDCFVDQFSEAKVADPARAKLADKVQVQHEPAITAKGSRFRHMVRVEVLLNNGKKLARTVETAIGSGKRFGSEADVISKFEKLAIHAVPKAQLEQLRDAILGLDRLPDVTSMAVLLKKP